MSYIHPDLLLQRDQMISRMAVDGELRNVVGEFLRLSEPYRYAYNFDWLGRPIIQFPQDIVAMQELLWTVKPDVVIETGVAHGGSLLLSASILAMLDMADHLSSKNKFIKISNRKVIGIDIDIRPHNRKALEEHPFFPYIDLLQGSSIDANIFKEVESMVPNGARVLVSLDSNHTHSHVLRELELYSQLVTPGSYCVVWDTSIEFDGPSLWKGKRSWGPGNSPYSAVQYFLQSTDCFQVDQSVDTKLLITVAPGGFLKRVR
jgi:cephalosporin hydroxylase